MNLRSLVAILALLAAAACTEPLEFADWTIPVPEGTPVHEYAPASSDEREGNRIELVEDLVFGDSDDPQSSLHQPAAVAIDDAGTVFVADRGDKRVVVFDTRGRFVRTFGQEGQGPGEFQRPSVIAVVDGQVVVYDSQARRLSVWTTDGEHVADRVASGFRGVRRMAGTSDGQLTISYLVSLDTGSRIHSVGTFTVDGEKVRDLGRFRVPPEVIWRGETVVIAPVPQPYFALSGAGVVYVPGDYLYQVVAVSEAGESLWALRVAGTSQPFPRSYVEKTETMLEEWYPGIPTSEFLWPELGPIFADVRVDGHGNLYVFPFTVSEREPMALTMASASSVAQQMPVDVYSPAGERVFVGYFPARGYPFAEWEAAWTDYIFRFVESDEYENAVLIRYRVRIPWDNSVS